MIKCRVGHKKRIRKIIKRVVVVILILVFIFGAMAYRVDSEGKKHISTIEKLPKDVDAIIVLGAGIKNDGSPSDILNDRLETAIEIRNYINESKLIMTGDHGKKNYNEVKTMKNFAVRNDVEEKDIFMDHAGFNTYDSMYRAKKIFGVKKAIIVTNEYHLPRALYIANKMGIEAYGVASDKRRYYFMDVYKKREILAQVKAFIEVNISRREPKFLGSPIPITGDGRQTEDGA